MNSTTGLGSLTVQMVVSPFQPAARLLYLRRIVAYREAGRFPLLSVAGYGRVLTDRTDWIDPAGLIFIAKSATLPAPKH